MANIDSLRTARMFDEKKLYTGADIIAALERLALSGEYEHAKPAKILVMGDYVAHEMSATMPRFAVRPENDGSKCNCKREAPTESGEHDPDTAWSNQFASFWVGALMGLLANMNNGQ